MDLCCFNRPYDDQKQNRIRIETESKIVIQQKIKSAECDLLWSAILDLECSFNPVPAQRMAILHWRTKSCDQIMINESVLKEAKSLLDNGIGTYDAMHAACAIVGQADLFITTDDRLLKRLQAIGRLVAMLPQNALATMEGWYEN
ncbi:PIN domain-containing protein [Candidatus Viridilinea mediisalina]|uniref:PIN domain protein n=1 Tax=Candidatus Viridilinea mediisalina TaxID=2024553 RepID=A0A2A6RDD0_9CHLR|nr:PIN domain-containing protein [Candidatus Viridilinea mediisalina]PDV98203.1 PIN domain protein [Candidatus Viridilinea mediisalina]